jgi:hypothetical protein
LREFGSPRPHKFQYLRVLRGVRTGACGEHGPSCTLRGLPVGESVMVQAGGALCASTSRAVVLTSGANAVTLPCGVDRPEQSVSRRVQGVVRTFAGEALDQLSIRCAGAHSERSVHNSLVFSVPCPRAVESLEYRLAPGGPWASVAIPPAVDPAFVEIRTGPL